MMIGRLAASFCEAWPGCADWASASAPALFPTLAATAPSTEVFTKSRRETVKGSSCKSAASLMRNSGAYHEICRRKNGRIECAVNWQATTTGYPHVYLAERSVPMPMNTKASEWDGRIKNLNTATKEQLLQAADIDEDCLHEFLEKRREKGGFT